MTRAVCSTGKTVWPSKAAATRSRGARRNQGRRMRAYLCPHCHGWHLTTEAYAR